MEGVAKEVLSRIPIGRPSEKLTPLPAEQSLNFAQAYLCAHSTIP